MKTRNIRRRTATAAVAAIAAVSLALGGCAAAPADVEEGPVTLRFWAWGSFQPEAVEIWNAQNPDIQVVVDKIPSGNSGGYAKMHAAILAGNPPDLGTIEFQTFPSFMLNDELVDITDYLTQEQIDSYIPWMYEQGVVDGRSYLLPYGSGPMGLFYRTDIFDDLGIAVPTTWEEYADAAEAIHAADPTMYISGFDTGGAVHAAFAWQAGAKWFGTEGDSWTVNLTDDATEKVADYWQDLVNRDLVKVENAFSDTWYKNLQEGKVATWIAPSWGGVTLQTQAPDTAGNWRMADLPQWGGEFASSNWGGSGAAVFRGSKHPKEAAQFAAWLGGSVEAANIGAKYLNWPAIVDVSEVDNVRVPLDFYGGQTLESVFEKSANSIDTSWKWIPNFDTANNAIADGLKHAVTDGSSFAQVFADAQDKTIADLQLIGLNAKAGK